MPPTPLVGTCWSVASRTTLRVVAGLVTARKLKCDSLDVDEHARLQIAFVRQARADAAVQPSSTACRSPRRPCR